MEHGPHTNEDNLKPVTTEELELMLEAIDSEIVGVGENISDARLKELTIKKGSIARKIAEMKGEEIKKGSDTSFNE